MAPPPSSVALIAEGDDVGLVELPCVGWSVFEIITAVLSFHYYTVVNREDLGIGVVFFDVGIGLCATLPEIGIED